MIGAYVLSILAFYVVARYRMPLVPFLILFAAAAMVRLRRSCATWTAAGTAAGVTCLAATTVFCNFPILSAETMRAVTYQNLGTTLQEAGRLDEAAAAFEQALALEPGYAPAHNGLGSVRRQQGRFSEAISHLEAALRLRPDFDGARFNLANALGDGGHRAEAIANYEELLRRLPNDVGAHVNIGVALAEEGRLDQAVEHFRRVIALAPTAKAHYTSVTHCSREAILPARSKSSHGRWRSTRRTWQAARNSAPPIWRSADSPWRSSNFEWLPGCRPGRPEATTISVSPSLLPAGSTKPLRSSVRLSASIHRLAKLAQT
jgi:cytochrome c-type biogenesis protein CcmH/NrfG